MKFRVHCRSKKGSFCGTKNILAEGGLVKGHEALLETRPHRYVDRNYIEDDFRIFFRLELGGKN